MRWRISNDNHSLDGFFSPILKQAEFETALHILRHISSSLSFDSANEGFCLLNVLIERHNFEAAMILDISVAYEGHPALETAIFFAFLDCPVNNFVYSLFGFGNPGPHRRGAVKQQAKLKHWLSLDINT